MKTTTGLTLIHRCVPLLLCTWLGAAAAAPAADMPVAPIPWQALSDPDQLEKNVNDHLAAAQASIDRLVAVRGRRTLDNTLRPYDEAVREIANAGNIAGLLQEVHPAAALRDRATAMTLRVSAADTALSLNPDVYRALLRVDAHGSDAATRYYLQHTLLEFRLSGVNRDAATRAKIKALSDALTDETSKYERNIADNARTVRLTAPDALAGMPQDFIDRHKPDADGAITLTTNYPDVYPVLRFARSDDTRRRVWTEFQDRAWPVNRGVLDQMVKTRYEIARLAGFASWADYNAADKMIGSARAIGAFIDQLDQVVQPLAKRETAELLEEKRRTVPGATEVLSYEKGYYAELLRREKYGFDSGSLRPYLPFDEVRQGVMDNAARLFHLTFRRVADAVAWDPSVETWDALEDGRVIGRFFLDMHPRTGKFSHAAEFPVFPGVRGVQLPQAALVCNFPQPSATDPGLMEFDDAVTFFHEFGHLMHQLLGGQVAWAGVSGTHVQQDFVEAPSQMLEEWMHDPAVLASFARHYQTGEPVPAALVADMNRATAFGRASFVAAQNAYSAMSYDMYRSPPATVDPEAIVLRDLRRYAPTVALPTDAHLYAAFGHLAGYSSAYYTYMWDKVIAEDFFAQFDPRDPFAGDAPLRYRQRVLEPGGSMDGNDLIRGFLGRPQDMRAFERWVGAAYATGEAPAH